MTWTWQVIFYLFSYFFLVVASLQHVLLSLNVPVICCCVVQHLLCHSVTGWLWRRYSSTDRSAVSRHRAGGTCCQWSKYHVTNYEVFTGGFVVAVLSGNVCSTSRQSTRPREYHHWHRPWSLAVWFPPTQILSPWPWASDPWPWLGLSIGGRVLGPGGQVLGLGLGLGVKSLALEVRSLALEVRS